MSLLGTIYQLNLSGGKLEWSILDEMSLSQKQCFLCQKTGALQYIYSTTQGKYEFCSVDCLGEAKKHPWFQLIEDLKTTNSMQTSIFRAQEVEIQNLKNEVARLDVLVANSVITSDTKCLPFQRNDQDNNDLMGEESEIYNGRDHENNKEVDENNGQDIEPDIPLVNSEELIITNIMTLSQTNDQDNNANASEGSENTNGQNQENDDQDHELNVPSTKFEESVETNTNDLVIQMNDQENNDSNVNSHCDVEGGSENNGPDREGENNNDEELIRNDRDYVKPGSSSVSNVKKIMKIGNPASLKRQCNLCKKKFKMNEFKKHIQLKGQKDHRCCICNKVFANRLSTYAHIREVHKGKKKETLNISSKNATKSDDFQKFTCIFHNTCEETFKTDEELEDHVQEKHPDAKLSKEDINELFLARYKEESKRLMTFMNCWPNPAIPPEKLAHAGFIFTRRGDNVQCAFCAGVLGDWEETDDPMTVHKESFPKCSKVIKSAKKPRALYPRLCKKPVKSGPKVGKRKTKMTKIRRPGSTGLSFDPITKQYKCKKCSCTFETKTAGKKHVSKEHEIQVQFSCDYCNMKFFEVTHLQRHMKGVKDEGGKHKCNLCDFKSCNKYGLSRHIRKIHEGNTGNSLFPCRFCDMKFRSRIHLDCHIKSVKDEGGKHKCNLCDFKSCNKWGLSSHRKKSHPETIKNKCDYCDKIFQTRWVFNIHMKNIHNIISNGGKKPNKHLS